MDYNVIEIQVIEDNVIRNNKIENNSNLNYVNSSLASLSLIEKEAGWDSLLFVQINDCTLFKIIITNSLKKEPYKIDGTMISDSLDILRYRNLYNNLFPEINSDNDSLKVDEEIEIEENEKLIKKNSINNDI